MMSCFPNSEKICLQPQLILSQDW